MLGISLIISLITNENSGKILNRLYLQGITSKTDSNFNGKRTNRQSSDQSIYYEVNRRMRKDSLFCFINIFRRQLVYLRFSFVFISLQVLFIFVRLYAHISILPTGMLLRRCRLLLRIRFFLSSDFSRDSHYF